MKNAEKVCAEKMSAEKLCTEKLCAENVPKCSNISINFFYMFVTIYIFFLQFSYNLEEREIEKEIKEENRK